MDKSSLPPNQHWLTLEYRHSSTGLLPEARDLNHSQFISQLSPCGSPRKSETIALRSTQSDPWLKLSTLLSRGRLDEARNLITRLEGDSLYWQPSTLCEIVAKKARLAGYEGNWAEVLRNVELARSVNPPLQTRLTLHQMAGIAHFELGDINSAASEADRYDSLVTILPFAPTAIYNKVLKTKIAARDQGTGAGKKLLRQLWREAEENSNLSPDLALTLFRLEVDLRRLNGEQHADPAFASYLLAEALGDGLYSGLALLDLYYALSPESRVPFSNILNQFAAKYQRIDRIWSGIEINEVYGSTTSRDIASFHFGGETQTATYHDKSYYKTLVHLNYGISIDLETLTVHGFSPKKQVFRALHCLSSSQGSKQDLFECIWGRKFAPHLHDTVIRNLIYRLRKQIGISVNWGDNGYGIVNNLVVK